MNVRKRPSPFSGEKINALTPEGFIVPLVYGLQALMNVVEKDGKQIVQWAVDPMPWLQENLETTIENYSDVLAPWGYDPQKVGKAPQSYNIALRAYKMALAGIL